MKVKSIVISRDSICSRMPGVIPSLSDSWSLPDVNTNCGNQIDINTFYEYSTAVAKAVEYGISSSLLEYNCEFVYQDNNYGLIVSDIIIPSEIAANVTDYTDFYVNIPKSASYDVTSNKNSIECEGDTLKFTAKLNNDDFYNLNDKTSEVHYEGRKIMSGGTEIKILTYTTLVKWYNYFKTYYRTIGNYDNALEYYQNEYEVKNATDEKKYSDMDSLFESRGGKLMYDWIKNNCFITYKIPDTFSKEWKVSELCYSDALKWQKWFQDRIDLYSGDCSKTIDCCECNEFKRLGGQAFLTELNEWIESVKPQLENDFAQSLNSASYSIPITLTTSIDDLGEMSIFSSDYEDGVDYHNRITGNETLFYDEESGGTVVNMPYFKDDYGNTVYYYDTYLIKNSETKGYKQNQFYENEFNYNDWFNYTDFYIRNHPEEFSTNGVISYAYSKLNGNIIYYSGKDTDILKYDKNTDTFYEDEIISYIDKPSVLIDGKIIEIIDGYYVIPNYRSNNVANILLKSNKIFPVTIEGNVRYVSLNDKRYYVKKDSEGVDKVYFLKDSNCYDEGVPVRHGRYIMYNGNIFLLNGNRITFKDFDTKHYTVVDGYFEYGGQTYYIMSNKILIPKVTTDDGSIIYFDYKALSDDDLDKLEWLKIVANTSDKTITISHKLDVLYSNKITGYTDSKLDLLRRRKVNTDELGNELPGYFDLYMVSTADLLKVYDEPCYCDNGEKSVQFNFTQNDFAYGPRYNTPYNECTLDLLYKIGEVSDIKKYSDGHFVGNYLDSIELYYLDSQGNHINSVFVEGEDSRPFLELFDEGGEKHIDDETLYCDITYYMDATLRDIGTGYERVTSDKSYIKYVDTAAVYKETGNFFMGDGTYFTFKYYWLSGMYEGKDIQDFNDEKYVNTAKFEFVPALYVPKKDLSIRITAGNSEEFDGSCLEDAKLSIDATEKDSVAEDSPWERNNGMMVAPVFRQEYNLGSSLSQNIDTNIYIDRGRNAAFEKHLKIMETHTLEALENYGNGYFKINKY